MLDIKSEILTLLNFARWEKPAMVEFIDLLQDAVKDTSSYDIDIHTMNDQSLVDILSILAMNSVDISVNFSSQFVHLAMLQLAETYEPSFYTGTTAH